jgi:hypothetical protein
MGDDAAVIMDDRQSSYVGLVERNGTGALGVAKCHRKTKSADLTWNCGFGGRTIVTRATVLESHVVSYHPDGLDGVEVVGDTGTLKT